MGLEIDLLLRHFTLAAIHTSDGTIPLVWSKNQVLSVQYTSFVASALVLVEVTAVRSNEVLWAVVDLRPLVFEEAVQLQVSLHIDRILNGVSQLSPSP